MRELSNHLRRLADDIEQILKDAEKWYRITAQNRQAYERLYRALGDAIVLKIITEFGGSKKDLVLWAPNSEADEIDAFLAKQDINKGRDYKPYEDK